MPKDFPSGNTLDSRGEDVQKGRHSRALAPLGFRAMSMASCLWMGAVVLGQTPDGVNPATDTGGGLPSNGVHLYAAGSGGYSSFREPSNLVTPGMVGGQALQGYTAWASATISYSHYYAGTGFGIEYSPSYSHVVDATEEGFSQRLGLKYFHQVIPKWTFFVSVAGSQATLEESLFTSQTQAVNATAAGDSPNAPIVFSPAPTLLFGSRVLSLSGDAGVTYSPSPRLHFSFDAGGADTQARPDTSQTVEASIPRMRTEFGTFDASYSVSPKTEIGGDATYSETSSGFGVFRYSQLEVHAGRKLGMRWYLAGAVGTGLVNNQASTLTYIGHAMLRYAGRENTVILSVRRAPGDNYGLGSSASEYYSAAWNWRQRNRAWSLQANADWQQQTGGVLGDIHTWDVGLGLSRSLGRQAGVTIGGSYLREDVSSAFNLAGEIAYAVRLTIYWIPLARDAGPRPDVP
jgi:hypothetical protein